MTRFPLRDYQRTGRLRVVPGWFRRMRLEVEWLVTEYSACAPRPGCDPKVWREEKRAEGERYCEWRKATWNDIYQLAELRGAAVR
jgi:hypothetical protein